MLYRFLADLAVVVHFGFIIFVVLGGLMVLRWPRLAWAHVPAFLWGSGISVFGWICPLTYLENQWRARGAAEGYHTSFIEEYILPLVYPETLFGTFPRSGFILIGIFVLVVNCAIYWACWQRRQHIEQERTEEAPHDT